MGPLCGSLSKQVRIFGKTVWLTIITYLSLIIVNAIYLNVHPFMLAYKQLAGYNYITFIIIRIIGG